MLNKFSILKQINSSKPAHRATFLGGGGKTHLGVGKRAAFTLAEVLITLGIIGVVAAMTIPTLISNYNEKVTVSKVKKMYSLLSQAYRLNLTQGDVVIDANAVNSASQIASIFLPHLKIALDCGLYESGCIYSGKYKYLSGSEQTINYNRDKNAYKVTLLDGSSIWFRYTENGTNSIFYDVNGVKPPNQWGHDLFEFLIRNDSVEACCSPDIIEASASRYSCIKNKLGLKCAYYIINNGNMDYLKK